MLHLVIGLMMTLPPQAFKAYCLDCHGDGASKGDLALDVLFEGADPTRSDQWIALRSRLRYHDMPPAGKRRPSEEEYLAMQAWTEARIGEMAEAAASPGRVGPRRLNNVEYENTIRDLFAVDIDAVHRFPADGVGEGFDNVADVLSLPPLLLEKYFDAAEYTALHAVHDEGNPGWTERVVDAGAMKTRGRVTHRKGVQWMPSRAAAGADFELPRQGAYTLRFGAFGQQAGSEPVKLQVVIEGNPGEVIEIPATRSNPGTYERTLDLSGGRSSVELAFINDYYRPDDPDPSQRDRNAGLQWLSITGPVDSVEPSAFQNSLPHAAAGAGTEEHLRLVLEELVPRAWRRPVASEEIDRLLALSLQESVVEPTFEARLRTCIIAMLVSPNFLLRVERDPAGIAPEPLSGHELATRLSYFLWSTTPDSELLEAAERGELATPGGRQAQVDRMIASTRSRSLAEHFATQWLQIRSLDERTPDPRRYPGVDEALLRSMQRETIELFDAVCREDKPAWSLLDAEYTHADESLAMHYDLDWPEGAEGVRRIPLDGRRPPGLLGHGSILTATSNPTRTSPVKRGKWILESLLDDPPPPPLPGIDALPEAEGDPAHVGVRDLLALHTTDPECLSCHARMDPLGLALESLDAVGRVRPGEEVAAMDLQAILPDGRSFTGVEGLQELLLEDQSFLRALARNMLVYALGRGTTFADEALVLRLAATLQEDPRLRRLIHEIVESDAFRFRAGMEGEER